MKYAFVLAELMIYPLSVVCWVLGITQSGFYAWRGREPSKRECERNGLRAVIRKIFDAYRGRYGAPRIYREMCEHHGYTGSLNRIQTLMRNMGICAKAGKKYKATTDSGHQLPVAPNLLGQDFSCDVAAESTSHAKASRSGLVVRHHVSYAQTTKPAGAGAKLLEHVWNAVLDDVAVRSLPFLCCERK